MSVARPCVDYVVHQRAGPLFLGAEGVHLYDSFCGSIHELRLYDRPLSLEELSFAQKLTAQTLEVRTRTGTPTT